MSTLRARRGELALLLLGLIAGLVLIELALRLTGAATPPPSGYAPLRLKKWHTAPMVFNSRGHRDVERAIPKPPGVRRILSLGDSFAWGASIEYDDTYAQRIERYFNRSGDARWEVVQLAHPGMYTAQEAAQLFSEGFAYEPDAVMLGFVLNDAEDENAPERTRARDWAMEKRARAESPGLLDRIPVYRFVHSRIRSTQEGRRRIANYRAQYEPNCPGWLACEKALNDIGRACSERHIPFLVMVFPMFGNPLDDTYPFADIHTKVDQVAERAGATVLDLLPLVRGLRWDLLVVDGADDEHPNEIAHRIAANAAIKVLRNLLPPPPTWKPPEGPTP